jgi:hypothetical protein
MSDCFVIHAGGEFVVMDPDEGLGTVVSRKATLEEATKAADRRSSRKRKVRA